MATNPSPRSPSEAGPPAADSITGVAPPIDAAPPGHGHPPLDDSTRLPGAWPDDGRTPHEPSVHDLDGIRGTADISDDRCIRVAQFVDDGIREWQGFGDLESALAKREGVFWIDLTDPAPEHVAVVARLLGLHPLVAEDILEGNQRAKVEVTDELVHIVMFALRYEGELTQTEIDFILGDTFLLTVHEHTWDPRAATHLRGGLAPIMKRGPDHLLWAQLDALVDGYFPFIDKMGDEIDDIEDRVVTHADSRVLARLFQLKKDLLTARHAIAPVREIFNQLTNREMLLIDREEIVYFRDIYDHLLRLTDELDNYRELASSALDVYLSTVNNNLSLIMKRLTGVTVILAGVGAVAGIFGMSEATNAILGGEGNGFWIITGSIVLLAAIAGVVLRKIGWI
jgi:magnesium transporter